MSKQLSTEKTMTKEIIQIDHSNCQTMTSREISQLTGKRHDHVLRDIDKLSNSYREIGLPKVGEGLYCHEKTGSQTHKLYFLTKIQTLDLMSGYDTKLRIKIIRRWEELEKKNSLSIPSNFAQALRLAADQAEKIAILAPKAELADKCIRDEETQYCIRDAGKQLGLSQKEIFSIMRDKGLLTKNNMPTQKAINYGVLVEKSNLCDDGRNRKQAVMDMKCIGEFNKRYCKKAIK